MLFSLVQVKWYCITWHVDMFCSIGAQIKFLIKSGTTSYVMMGSRKGQPVKCLLCRLEELGVGPQHPRTSWGGGMSVALAWGFTDRDSLCVVHWPLRP